MIINALVTYLVAYIPPKHVLPPVLIFKQHFVPNSTQFISKTFRIVSIDQS